MSFWPKISFERPWYLGITINFGDFLATLGTWMLLELAFSALRLNRSLWTESVRRPGRASGGKEGNEGWRELAGKGFKEML